MRTVRAFAPGRVNLIGDHTDYTDGRAMPMAVEWGTTVEVRRGGERVQLTSSDDPEPAVVDLDVVDPAELPAAFAAPGGLSARALRGFLGAVVETCTVVGAEITSAAPGHAALAAEAIEPLLGPQ